MTVVAGARFKTGDFVCEYEGELLEIPVAKKREERYKVILLIFILNSGWTWVLNFLLISYQLQIF